MGINSDLSSSDLSLIDAVLASCMRNLLTSVDVSDLTGLLKNSRDTAQSLTAGMHAETTGRIVCQSLRDIYKVCDLIGHFVLASQGLLGHCIHFQWK